LYHKNDGSGSAVTSHFRVPFPDISMFFVPSGGLPVFHLGATVKTKIPEGCKTRFVCVLDYPGG